ncbi:ARF-binding protein [Blastocladiella emersonii ATCC 22665]|nr:ARF-binding protein [Blastocladiella emersonii ATCC 22665]
MALNNLFSSTLGAMAGVAQAINQIGAGGPRTPIDDYLESACSPHRMDPDLALNLEICDLINTKGRTYPRDAAMGIVRLVNSRHETISSHALELLDICVKNCGFPFHLQIASKEFLNELVKRFPERPPMLLPHGHRRILEFINQWNLTLVQNGKHKEDLRNITEMYRLLSQKGYRFPGVAQSAVAVLNQRNETLRSADELEEEDVMVKKAKLQELLRRASPADLEQANQLMKELVGFEGQVDYKAKEREELTKFEDKAKRLEAMLQEVTSPVELQSAAIQDLLIHCKSAQAKCVKLIETREDDDHLQRLLDLNDQLNRVIGAYRAIQTGTPVQQQQQQPTNTTLISWSPSTSPAHPPAQPPAAAAARNGGGNVMDDLLDLSFGAPPAAPLAGGSLLGGPSPSAGLGFGGGLAPMAGMAAAQQPDLLGGGGGEGAIFLAANTPPTQATTLDFGGFFGGPSSSPVPAARQQSPVSVKTTGTGGMDLLGMGLATPPASAGTPTSSSAATMQTQTVYDANGLCVTATWARNAARAGQVDAQCEFANRTLTPILALSWQVAAPRGVQLKVEPLSAQVIPASAAKGAYQRFSAQVGDGAGELKVKFKVGFASNGVNVDGEGVFSLA